MGKLYTKIFAKVYDRVMNSIEYSLDPYRKSLIGNLTGKVLEVGVGTGVNFKYYQSGVQVVALDPSQAMIDKALPKIPNGMNLRFLPYGINDVPVEERLQNHSFDAIVCTLVLCTIPRPEEALQQFKSLLKPDGKLLVLEHIQHPNKWMAKWYNIVNPAWKIIGDGCNLNRYTPDTIVKAGFDVAENNKEHYFKKGLPFYTSVYTMASS